MKNYFSRVNLALACFAFITSSSFAQTEQFLLKDQITSEPVHAIDKRGVTVSSKSDWSDASLKAVDEMKGKYGVADETTDTKMTWYNKGPWKEIIVYSEAIQHDFPMPHMDVMESILNYKVPPNKFDDIAMFDGSISINRTRGTMSAMCDKEANNFLAINVAHDIIKNVRTSAQARVFFAKTITDAKNGNVSPYMKNIGFDKMSNTLHSDVNHNVETSQVKMMNEQKKMKMKAENKKKDE